MEFKKISTGIDSVDLVMKGGLPSGSFILLLGEVGAGSAEFTFTSAIMLSLLKTKALPAEKGTGISIPDAICYVSLTRSKADILKEISLSFAPEYYEVIKENLIIKDFSKDYFKTSLISIPEEKITFESLRELGSGENLLSSLMTFLAEKAPNNLVIIDSLTDLMRMYTGMMKWQDLISFLKGLQRASKEWDGLIYALLTANIFERGRQEEIADCADGVLIFEWSEIGTAQRQRAMYVKKFRGLLPQLEADNIAKFEIRITPNAGFEVSNIQRIMGRR
ncbi:MAG: hypothetical protein KAU16_05020 [Methanophagales archaeon]|nr:hypothetical protein [Methanophagales archaeon]